MCGSEFLTMTMTSTNCNGSRESTLPRTKYLKHTLHLTLDEMYNGTIRKLAVNKNRVCDVCLGIGSISQRPEDFDTCEECCGLGARTLIFRRGPDIEEQIERECDLCWGKGEVIIPEDRCLTCEGRKVVAEQCILIVKVRRGTRHGQKIIYKAEGTQEPNMRPGDVVVILEAIDHPIFKRDGDDLTMTVRLDLVESLCGFEKLITTLDRRQLFISGPRGKVIQTNDVKYVVGEGMPKFRSPKERGNLRIRFEVNIPATIRARHVPALEECLPPRQLVDIPMDAVECNLITMEPGDDLYNEHITNAFNNEEEPPPDIHYVNHRYQTHPQYEHDDGMHQYSQDGQYDHQGQYYHDENSYEVQGNYEHASEYDQHYSQQVYDSHGNFHQEEFYQQEDDSLESYDATQQFRFND